MPSCRACRKAITFEPTSGGRKMPVDADSWGVHELVLGTRGPGARLVVLDTRGRTMAGRRAVEENAREARVLVKGWTSHYATCPAAATFRRERPFVPPRQVDTPAWWDR